MGRPTMEDLRKQVADIEDEQRREELRVIGYQAVVQYHYIWGICPFCTAEWSEPHHAEPCTGQRIDAYIEKYGARP